MKNKIIKIIKCPILWVFVSVGFTTLCYCLMAYLVHLYPNAADDDMFIEGVRFGALLFAFLEGIYYSGSFLISLGKWLHKRKVENNGSSNSKD